MLFHQSGCVHPGAYHKLIRFDHFARLCRNHCGVTVSIPAFNLSRQPHVHIIGRDQLRQQGITEFMGVAQFLLRRVNSADNAARTFSKRSFFVDRLCRGKNLLLGPVFLSDGNHIARRLKCRSVIIDQHLARRLMSKFDTMQFQQGMHRQLRFKAQLQTCKTVFKEPLVRTIAQETHEPDDLAGVQVRP